MAQKAGRAAKKQTKRSKKKTTKKVAKKQSKKTTSKKTIKKGRGGKRVTKKPGGKGKTVKVARPSLDDPIEEDLEEPLSQEEERFVRKYLVDLNATEAYAYVFTDCKRNTAATEGCKLLKKPNIQRAIKAGQKRLKERLEISAEKVLQEYAKIGFADMDEFADWANGSVDLVSSKELPKELTACVSEVSISPGEYGDTVKFKLHDKKGALDALAKHLELFPSKTTVIGDSARPVAISIGRQGKGK